MPRRTSSRESPGLPASRRRPAPRPRSQPGAPRSARPGPARPPRRSPTPPHPTSARSQQRSKSEMLSRKNFAAGVPAVSMDELAAFADSYAARSRRADGDSHEARGGGRFERSEARALGGFYPDGSPDEYYGPRGRSREPLGDAGRAWAPSPPRRRPDDAPLPRLVSRTPGTAPKYEHGPRAGGLERQARPEGASRGGSLETPSRLSAQLGRRSASYYAWSPPSTYKAAAPQDDDEDDDDSADDPLPPYSERELSRGPSYRGRDLPYHSNSEKKRKKEPAKKTVRPRRRLPRRGVRAGAAGTAGGGEGVCPAPPGPSRRQ